MKVNIHKYEGGGGFILPTFTRSTPTQEVPTATSLGSRQPQTKDQGTSGFDIEEIYKELIKNGGLTSDVNNLMGELAKVDLVPSFLLDSNNTTKVVRLIGKVNEIKNNNEM